MKIYRMASLSFYVKGRDIEQELDTIYNVAVALNAQLHNEWWQKYDHAYYLEMHTVPPSETITIDGFDVDATSGTINFYVEGIKDEQRSYYLNKIKWFLKSENIKYGELKLEQSRMYDVPVVRIPISINQNEHEASDKLPQLNISNNNAFFIFNKVLKFDVDLWEEYEFNAKDMKRRIEYFEGEEQLPEGPMSGNEMMSMDDLFSGDQKSQDMLSGRAAMSNYDEQKVREVLSRIKAFCEWAIENGYDTIYVA